MKLENYLTEAKNSKLLKDIKNLKRRLDEVEAIAKAGESPFQALSNLKYDINIIMDNISLKKY